MNSLLLVVATLLVSTAHGQFEAGHVKILEDSRYQEGQAFGNYRNQEDGIKYKEETNNQGIRTGFWEYPDETGQIKRVEFEAGPGIGFRIVNSNIVAPTPIAKKTTPVQQQRAPVFQPQPQHQPRPQPPPQKIQPLPQQIHSQPLPRIPLVQQQTKPVIVQQPQQVQQPEPVNLFDYPADLSFFRDAGGHRFKFTAV